MTNMLHRVTSGNQLNHRPCTDPAHAAAANPSRAPITRCKSSSGDRPIAPIDPSSVQDLIEPDSSFSSTPAAGPAARRAARQDTQQIAQQRQGSKRPNTRHDANRGGLVKIRVAPRR